MFSVNKHNLNNSKSKIFQIPANTSRQYHIDLRLNNFVLECQNTTRSLSISIQNNLKWQSHIDHLCKQAYLYFHLRPEPAASYGNQ